MNLHKIKLYQLTPLSNSIQHNRIILPSRGKDRKIEILPLDNLLYLHLHEFLIFPKFQSDLIDDIRLIQRYSVLHPPTYTQNLISNAVDLLCNLKPFLL